MAKVKKMKKYQPGGRVKRDSIESEMFPGKMIPIEKSNYENGSYTKMLNALKPKPKAKPNPVAKTKPTVKKKAQGGDSLKAKLMTEYGPKKFAVDTAGYAAGKQKFPATVSSKKSSSTKSVSRGTVNRMIGAPIKSGVVRQTRSQFKASKKGK